MAKLAYIGLGVMGYPMAGHLQAGGHQVTVFNRNTAKAEQWVKQHGGSLALSPREAATGADCVFSCVGADDDLRQVTLGDTGAFAGMQAGAVFIDNTTTSAQVARELHARAGELQLGFVDAPVSGGQAGAENGKLTVMCGGEQADFAKAEPFMRNYGANVMLIGEPGSGQLTKMVNQICAAGVIQSLAEGINFGQCAGLDMQKVLQAIGKGAAQSWQMDNRGESMTNNEFDFGFAVDWMAKDLEICAGEARANGARLPLAEQVTGYYKKLSSQGFGRNDTSALIRLLR